MNTTTKIGIGLCLLLIFIAGAGFLGSAEDEASRFNAGWNGASGFYDVLDENRAEQLRSCEKLSGEGVLIIVEPKVIPDSEETTAITSFLSNGGTIIIFAQNASANAFLSAIGSSMTVQPGNLSSVDIEYNNPRMIRGYPFGNDTLTKGIEHIVTDQPLAVSGGTPIITTSILSWDDTNGNQMADDEELFGRYTILATETTGDGRLCLLGNTGLLINGMNTGIQQHDNQQLFENLIQTNGTIWYDTRFSGPFYTTGPAGLIAAVKSTMIIKILAVLLTIGIIGAFVVRRLRGYPQ